MNYKYLILLLLFNSLWSNVSAEILYESLSTRCLVKSEPENFMYAGIQVSAGGQKAVRIGAQTVADVPNNQFIPQIEVKTFPEGVSLYHEPNPYSLKLLETTFLLSEGFYTITVSPATAAEGLAIVYARDASPKNKKTLESISTRCYMGSEPENAMIAGIQISGEKPRAEFISYRIDEIPNNQILPALSLETFPDGQFFTEVTSLYNNPNTGYDGNIPLLHRIQNLSQGLYTATIRPSNQAGIGIITVTKPKIITPVSSLPLSANKPIQLSADNKTMLIGSEIWDLETGEQRLILDTQGVYAPPKMAFSPLHSSGRIVVAVYTIGKVELWNTYTGEKEQEFSLPQGTWMQMALSPDGEQLAVSGLYSEIDIWDISTGAQRHSIPIDIESPHTFEFDPTGKLFAATTLNGNVHIWETRTFNKISSINTSADTMLFSPNGKIIVTTNDNIISIWDTLTGKQIAQGLTQPTDEALSLFFNPDGHILASSNRNEENMLIWNMLPIYSLTAIPDKPLILNPEPKFIQKKSNNSNQQAHTFSSDWSFLATTHSDGNIYFEAVPELNIPIKVEVDHFTPITPKTLISSEDIQSLPKKIAACCDLFNLVVSPDGHSIATHSDEYLFLWDVKTGTEIGRLENQSYATLANPLRFSPNGKILAFASQDNMVQLFDLTTGNTVLTLKEDPAVVQAQSIAFSPDSQTIATHFQRNNIVHLWDVATGSSIAKLEHDGYISAMAFQPDGKTLISAVNDYYNPPQSTLYLWNIATGQQISVKNISRHINAMAFSPDGKTLVAGQDELFLLDTVTLDEVAQFSGKPSNKIKALSFSPNGKILVSSGGYTGMIFWDMNTRTLLTHGQNSGYGQFITDNVFASYRNQEIFLYDVSTLYKQQIPTQNTVEPVEQPSLQNIAIKNSLQAHSSDVSAMAFSADGNLFASGANRFNSNVYLWNPTTGKQLFSLGEHYTYTPPPRLPPQILFEQTLYESSYILSLDFSSDGKVLVSSSSHSEYHKNNIELWDTATGNNIGRLKGHVDRIKFVRFSPDNKRLASRTLSENDPTIKKIINSQSQIPQASTNNNDDKLIHLWDVDSQTETHQIDVAYLIHSSRIEQLEFSPDGNTLIAVFADNVIRSWDVATGLEKTAFVNNNYDIHSSSLSADTAFMASSKVDSNTIQIWDTATGQLLRTLAGHSDTVDSLLFSLDNQTLISNSADGTLLFWDIETGNIRHAFSTVNKIKSSKMTLSDDGKQLAVVDSEGLTVQFWNISIFLQ
ncbi:WD40 repeat domain-containing protein [Candidatus Albibeggiatoa sp. nov. NOAA]|uniref:WD40 repeat domain-containing protein n=1 Tax=Candidatus Albibeggiatoa sp. nov. NOAA TaxID=3162724 RepID=UPI0032F8AAA1|nr:WD40 repeat domain-containing protein [Thiotrichaceae bacterium]